MAVAVAVSEGGAVAVAVAVAGLTKRFFNHMQKNFLINVWGCFTNANPKINLDSKADPMCNSNQHSIAQKL